MSRRPGDRVGSFSTFPAAGARAVAADATGLEATGADAAGAEAEVDLGMSAEEGAVAGGGAFTAGFAGIGAGACVTVASAGAVGADAGAGLTAVVTGAGADAERGDGADREAVTLGFTADAAGADAVDDDPPIAEMGIFVDRVTFAADGADAGAAGFPVAGGWAAVVAAGFAADDTGAIDDVSGGAVCGRAVCGPATETGAAPGGVPFLSVGGLAVC